jgi:hypothetical protein
MELFFYLPRRVWLIAPPHYQRLVQLSTLPPLLVVEYSMSVLFNFVWGRGVGFVI